MLLDAGLAVDAADACGWAALTKAAAHSHLDLLTDLIARGHGLINTITGIGLPYVASALGIFLLRQTFKTIPRELEDAARIEGCNWLEILWKVYVPLAKPTY
ncbi:Lactose transport system permease protein lacG [Vreelandella boliviensis LC1]|uniref:Lactose transport system permease protein lacG n=1 Tax=Vreelandella boliviensis LC1 TaxID=1072583 RepID=A0A7U9C5N9_9GAMM|nr:Lactose transport system permease protein lacG [Halomonas boliviensis LC1]